MCNKGRGYFIQAVETILNRHLVHTSGTLIPSSLGTANANMMASRRRASLFIRNRRRPKGSHPAVVFRRGLKYLPYFRTDSQTLDWLPDGLLPAPEMIIHQSWTRIHSCFILPLGISSQTERLSLIPFIYRYTRYTRYTQKTCIS